MAEINIRHLLIVALGYHTYLHEEIDKIYEKRRWEYYEEYKKSFDDDMVINSFSSVRQEKMKKVAGIVQWCYKHNRFEDVQKMINKGYRVVTKYFEQNKQRLDFYELSKHIQRKHKEIGEQELIMSQIILIYLTYSNGLSVERLFNNSYADNALKAINHLIYDLGISILTRNKIEKSKEKQKETEIFIYQTLGMDINKKSLTTVDELLDHVVNVALEESFIQEGVKQVEMDDVFQRRSQLFYKEPIKYIGAFSSVLKHSTLNDTDLLDVKITKMDVMVLGLNALERIEGNHYTKEEAQHYFIGSLYIYALMEQYKISKEILMDDSMEAWYLDVKNQEKIIADKEKFYERNKIYLEKELLEHQTKMEVLAKENKALKEEMQKLQKKQKEFETEKEELIELRDFVYHQKKSDVMYDSFTIKEAADVLRKRKLAICGGHPNMQKKIKEWLPDIATISTDTLGKRFDFLSQYDAVFFYPNYANHSFYLKIKSAIKDKKTKFCYLPDVDNMERIMMEMYAHI